MEGMSVCHKCKKRITGRLVYAGGWVWHPACYPKKRGVKVKRNR